MEGYEHDFSKLISSTDDKKVKLSDAQFKKNTRVKIEYIFMARNNEIIEYKNDEEAYPEPKYIILDKDGKISGDFISEKLYVADNETGEKILIEKSLDTGYFIEIYNPKK